MKIAVLTLGCRTNQAESARIEEMLQAVGHQIVSSTGEAEICIINTCSVTAKADYQSRQLISRTLKVNAQVFVTGCYSELNAGIITDKNSTVKVVPNKDKDHIINMIPHATACDILPSVARHRRRPVIKVQDGCNNECSYCIIQKARGKSSSVVPDKVLQEIDKYHALGFEEIVLSGIHLGIYGRDLKNQCTLAKLLEIILKQTSIKRIRLSSIEVNELTPQLLDILSDNRICKHLHLPMQSGDDYILGLMNRSYTSSEYRISIENILKRFNNIGIGTDVIVGFPGERDDNFNKTLHLIDNLRISYLHVFPYSSRPGTPAALMPHHVPESLKKSRAKRLREIGNIKKEAFIRNNIGLEHDIVIETLGDAMAKGTTSNYIRVHVSDNSVLKPGSLVRVRLTGARDGNASGIAL